MKMAQKIEGWQKGCIIMCSEKGWVRRRISAGAQIRSGQARDSHGRETGREEKSMNTLRRKSEKPAFTKQEGTSRLRLFWIRIAGGKLQETKMLCLGF